MEPLAKIKEPFRKHLSEHLKRYRKLRDWDQHDMAAAVGLSAGGIRGYEQQTRFPKPEELQKLADLLCVSPSKLLEDPNLPEDKAPQTSTIESLTRIIEDQEKRLAEFAKITAEPLIARFLRCSDDEKTELAKYMNVLEYARESAKKSSKVTKKIE